MAGFFWRHISYEIIEIPLPSYWKHLNENPQVWVSPIQMFAHCTGWVDNQGERILVHVEKGGEYNVLLIGTRKDIGAVSQWNGPEIDK